MRKTVIIADDQKMFAEGMQCLLDNNDDFEVKAVTISGADALRLSRDIKPDLLIVNCNMTDISGLDILAALEDDNIKINAILIASQFDIEQALQSVNYNAGYILKTSSFDKLLEAVDTVCTGCPYIESQVIDSINRYLAKHDNDADIDLTHREIDILKMIVEGCLNKEIALALNISERTVKNHISSLFRKLGVSDRTQAAVYAIKNNLV